MNFELLEQSCSLYSANYRLLNKSNFSFRKYERDRKIRERLLEILTNQNVNFFSAFVFLDQIIFFSKFCINIVSARGSDPSDQATWEYWAVRLIDSSSLRETPFLAIPELSAVKDVTSSQTLNLLLLMTLVRHCILRISGFNWLRGYFWECLMRLITCCLFSCYFRCINFWFFFFVLDLVSSLTGRWLLVSISWLFFHLPNHMLCPNLRESFEFLPCCTPLNSNFRSRSWCQDLGPPHLSYIHSLLLTLNIGYTRWSSSLFAYFIPRSKTSFTLIYSRYITRACTLTLITFIFRRNSQDLTIFSRCRWCAKLFSVYVRWLLLWTEYGGYLLQEWWSWRGILHRFLVLNLCLLEICLRQRLLYWITVTHPRVILIILVTMNY